MSTGTLDTNTILAFAFGVVGLGAAAWIGLAVRDPTPLLVTIVKIILALAAAGVAATLSGSLNIDLKPSALISIRATGAMAVFVIVYRFVPAGLIAGAETPRPPSDFHMIVTENCGLQFKQRGAVLPIRKGDGKVLVVAMRREAFTILVPETTWKRPGDDYPALQVTLSERPGLFALANFDRNPVGNPFFWPGNGLADYAHGSATLFATSDLAEEHFPHSYIIGPRFNAPESFKRGFYVSAITAMDSEKNLIQTAKSLYAVFYLDTEITEASNHFERKPVAASRADLVRLDFS